jgi:hypothetical protein
MAFTWQNVGHAFASLFKDVVTVSKKAEVVLSSIQAEAPLVESLTTLVSPGAAAVEQLAFGALGSVVAVVHSTEDAAMANGINVSFDASVVAEIKAIIAQFPQIVSQVDAVFPKKLS